MSTVTVTLRQPAQLGDRARSDSVLSTQRHIPGAVLRGAFAAAWLRRHGEPKPGSSSRARFLALFEGGVRFGPLFHGEPFVSLSVLSHKYDLKDDCEENEVDEALLPPGEDAPTTCCNCGSPMEQVTHLRKDEENPTLVGRRTSVAIGDTGVAVRGKLFSRDSLRTSQVFTGYLSADDPGLLAELATLGQVRLGGRRTTHGLADVAIDESGDPDLPDRPDVNRLVLRLRSPGIFVDDEGRPTRDPNPAELASLLGSPATVLRRWTRWHPVGGWHAASGLPKPTELAVAAGSTYLIATDSEVPGEALHTLVRRGLGLRRHEGFGHLGPNPPLRPGGRGRRDEEARRETQRREAAEARQAEEDRIRRLADAVAPLLSLAVSRAWQSLLARMAAHAAGDVSATAWLDDWSTRDTTDLGQRRAHAAMRTVLTYDPCDVRRIVERWRTL